MLIDFDEIKIQPEFLEHRPSEKKMVNERYFYAVNEAFSAPIVIQNGTLVDGYIRYLILKERGYHGPVEVKEAASRVYVWGKHPGVDTEYVWRYPESNKNYANVGDKILVSTKNGLAPITVTRIEKLSTPPRAGRIRRVSKIPYVERINDGNNVQ